MPLFNPTTAGSGTPTEQTTSATGTVNNYDLDARFTYLRCNNASALVITGFTVLGAAPQAGDRVIVHQVAESTTRVADQDTGSTAAYRAIHPSTRGQIIGFNGAIEYVYDGTTSRWRMENVEPGSGIVVPFASGDYTGNGAMTWTVASGDVQAHRYQQRGRIVGLNLRLDSTSVGGTPNTKLKVKLPNSFVSANEVLLVSAFLRDNSTTQILGNANVSPGDANLYFGRFDGANWALATDTTFVGFCGEVEVQ